MVRQEDFNIAAAVFSSKQARAAAGISSVTFNNWTFGPDPILNLSGEIDKKAGGTGDDHKLSYRTVLKISIMKRLVDMGIQPRLAAKIGDRFCHLGNSWARYVGESSEGAVSIGEGGRLPGWHFSELEGDTLIVLSHDSKGEESIDVVSVLKGMADILMSSDKAVMIVVNATQIDEATRGKLGIKAEIPRHTSANK